MAAQERGTGWRMDQHPGDLRTVEDVRRALYSMPPAFCGKGWKALTTAEQYLATYSPSSRFVELQDA